MDSSAKFEYLKYISETEEADSKSILRDLMETYGDDVWNYAYSIVRKVDLADDITQDVFLKVYRNLTSYRGEASVKTWLLTITRNTAFDLKRSAAWRRVTLVELIQFQGAHQSAESEALEHLATSDIWNKVLALPAKYREVLILFAHHQLSMKEISAMLGVSEGTIKSRLHHARLKVIKMKERETDGSE